MKLFKNDDYVCEIKNYQINQGGRIIQRRPEIGSSKSILVPGPQEPSIITFQAETLDQLDMKEKYYIEFKGGEKKRIKLIKTTPDPLGRFQIIFAQEF